MNIDKIPLDLCERPQWVLWKIIMRNGKADKLPFQINGQMAKADDATTWNTMSAVLNKLDDGYSGIGYEFSADDPYCGIDLDGCRNPETGLIEDWAREWIKTFNSYSEVSPSKTGVKIFVRGKSPFATGRKTEVDFPKVGDKTPAVEIYDHARYFAVTGLRLGGVSPDIESRQTELAQFGVRFFPEQYATTGETIGAWDGDHAVIERAKKYMAKMPPAVSGSNGSKVCFNAACQLVKGFGLTKDQAMAAILDWNQTCQPPWSQRELEHKINDAEKQPGESGYLRRARPENYSSIRVPEYSEPEQQVEAKIVTLSDAVRQYYDYARSGAELIVDTGLPELDYALGGGIAPGEIVIIGARPSHGKSAVGLQMVHAASGNGWPCLILSLEMSAMALGKRTLQFVSDVPEESWRYRSGEIDRELEKHFATRSPVYIAESVYESDAMEKLVGDHVSEHGVKMVVIDYAQQMRGKGKSQYEQVSSTSRAIRKVVADTGVVAVVLCQISREVEKRDSIKVFNSDLRDSGQLEQDADVIVFGVWPWKINPRNDPNHYIFLITKNRNRPINAAEVACRFNPSRQMFMPVKKSGEWNPDNYRPPYADSEFT